VTEKVLIDTVHKHNAKAGMAVMMNPRTGEILAMANVPTYNPNEPSDLAKTGARNRIVTDAFEPGSTLKTFTFAAVLDAGKLRPEDRFDCEMGQLKIGKHRIRDDHPKGIITAAEVFKHSSNIGTVKIARRIGKDALWAALDRFGFGQLTHTGLPGERRGTLRSADQWRELDFVTHAFGQGVTVTPLQLTAAFSAIAAYGIYRPPILAKSAIGHDGREEVFPRPPGARGENRVMSEAAARTLLTIMQGVTEDGTAKAAYIPGYPVAGKTGTAQKVFGGRYDPHKYLASFVGIVPANDPRLVLSVLVDEPQGIHYGGVICAPAFKEIAEKALVYLGVPPTAPIVAAGKNKSAREAERKTAVPTPPDEVGDGPGYEESAIPLIEETDEDGPNFLAGETPLVDQITLPDFSGMSMGEAIHMAHSFGIELVPSGSGVAKSQLPKPGKVPRGTSCRVTFRP
jgi:cell division protein FtsI (penicillin-binding protein 3)